jgi:hypothetical protein
VIAGGVWALSPPLPSFGRAADVETALNKSASETIRFADDMFDPESFAPTPVKRFGFGYPAEVWFPPQRPVEVAHQSAPSGVLKIVPLQRSAKLEQPEAPAKANPLEIAAVVDNKTAIYDISAKTVYLPNGRRLSAHSGLGDRIDDPRFVHVHMHGATPPNIYDLSLREVLFHGVQAIRLTPIDHSKMFGRAGILAHPYMLGPSGQSNGCVSFDDYDTFLTAYLNGEIARMVVVRSLSNPPSSALLSMNQPDGRYPNDRY